MKTAKRWNRTAIAMSLSLMIGVVGHAKSAVACDAQVDGMLRWSNYHDDVFNECVCESLNAASQFGATQYLSQYLPPGVWGMTCQVLGNIVKRPVFMEAAKVMARTPGLEYAAVTLADSTQCHNANAYNYLAPRSDDVLEWLRSH